MEIIRQKIKYSIQGVDKYIESHKYKGYEPFDGLSSFLRPFTFNNLFAERVLTQIVLRSPINLRPLLGIKTLDSTKGRGYMAAGYLLMFQLTQEQDYKKKAIECLEWLINNKSPKFEEYSWANHYDFASRGGRYTKYDPIIVWTALIGQSFLDAYEIIGEKKYLEIANSVCDWILKLPREKTKSGTCLSYYALNQSSVHNSNMLGAAMLAKTAKFTGDSIALAVAKEAMEYSCSRQLANGAWYYGEQPMNRWIDNFHTGYNLDSLKCYIDNTGDKSYSKNLSLGFKYYKDNFIENSGRPKYYHNRTYPVDIQCAAQSIDTLAYFAEYDESSLNISLKVAEWTIDNMQDKDGYFYYRQLPFMKVKIPMLHWGQTTMYKALVHLLSKLS